MKELIGIHHVTAITSNAKKIYDFFTNILGMRLVKKTVNQDDINTYHLFFADDEGNAGTDMTFFDFKDIPKSVKGANVLLRTTFRVPNDEALDYWLKRFKHYDVKHSSIETIFNKKLIYFEDFDEQLYAIISDENDQGVKSGIPWKKGPVPNEFSITGLGPVFIRANNELKIDSVLTTILSMRKVDKEDNNVLYEMGEGGNGASLIIELTDDQKYSNQGYGGIHHIAFRVKDRKQIMKWTEYFNNKELRNSGYVDRFYFESLYAMIYPGLLFELATDGPGFIDDQETYENLGETLALPPKFKDKREYVESIVKPFDTVRSTKTFEKEYFD